MSAAGVPRNKRILIVDDNPAIHEDFRKVLAAGNKEAEIDLAETALFGVSDVKPTAEDYELVFASQGQEALEKVEAAVAENRPFAMAFVDVRMPPGWDGIETTIHLWKVAPDMQIVICTAYSDYSWDEMVEKVGQSDRLVILKKPFDNVEVQHNTFADNVNAWILDSSGNWSRLQPEGGGRRGHRAWRRCSPADAACRCRPPGARPPCRSAAARPGSAPARARRPPARP